MKERSPFRVIHNEKLTKEMLETGSWVDAMKMYGEMRQKKMEMVMEDGRLVIQEIVPDNGEKRNFGVSES